MKKLIILLLLPFLITAQGLPRAGGINNTQATVLTSVMTNFVGVQTTNFNAFAVYDFPTTFDYNLGLKTTDNLTEGSTNKYFSNTLARAAFSAGTGLVYSAGVFGLDSTTQGNLASISGKFNNPTGTIFQYVKGDGSLGTSPTLLSNFTNDVGYLTSVSFGGKTTTDLPEGVNLYWTSGRFNTALASKSTTDISEGTNQYYTDTRARASNSAGTGISYNSGTGEITNIAPDQTVTLTGANNLTTSGTYPNLTITQYIPSDNIVTRSINSSTYTISSNKIATVKYNIKISCTATIGSASTGKVLFQYSTNGGSTWIDAGEVENSNTVTLAVVLNSTTTQSGFIVWNVPANALCRLVPTVSGTTTITWVRGQKTY